MNRSDCPYFSETAPVCDDGECGCFECMERIAELRNENSVTKEEKGFAFDAPISNVKK